MPSWTRKYKNLKAEIKKMKNDMRLIMESWRSSDVLSEADAHSNQWLSQIKVSEFVQALEDNNNKVLNKDVIKKGLNAAMKRYAEEIKQLEGEERSKFDSLISKAMSADTVDVLADFATEQAEGAIKSVGAIGGAKAGAAVGTSLGPIGTVAGGLVGATIGWGLTKLVGATAKKGIIIAQDIGGALEDLDVEDQELNATPAFNLIDISDDYKKVIIGADGSVDKKEAAVLAIGFKRVASAYAKILEKIKSIQNLSEQTAEEFIAKNQALRDLFNEPMSNYMSETATEASRKAYSKMLDLQRNVTINQK
jgi:hypothetical protein